MIAVVDRDLRFAPSEDGIHGFISISIGEDRYFIEVAYPYRGAIRYKDDQETALAVLKKLEELGYRVVPDESLPSFTSLSQEVVTVSCRDNLEITEG